MVSMMSDVFRVSMVVGRGAEAVAELAGFAGGVEVPVGDPLQVPAVVLAGVAGVGVEALPGMEFAPSGDGWRVLDTTV